MQAFIKTVDGLVMGSNSFKTVLSFPEWPYQIPVVVMSRSMTEKDVPEKLRDKVTITSQEPIELMRTLKEKQGWSRAYIDGGKIIQSFLRCGLISDIDLFVMPVLLGKGKKLFGDVEKDVDLRLHLSRAHDHGIVENFYEVLRVG